MRRVLAIGILLAAVSVAWAQFRAEPEYRCVSEKRANVRERPSTDAPIVWRMWKFFPVQVVSYRGDWIRISDFEGDKAWMHESVLDETRCVQAKRQGAKLRKSPGGRVLWLLDRGYPFRVFSKRGGWLEVSDLGSASGWIHESDVWGASPDGS